MNIPTPTTSGHAERQYLHTLVAGAWLPLLQSTIIAVVVAIGTWIIAWLVFDAVDPHKPAILFFVLTWVYMLIKLQRHWLSLTTVEQFIQRDLNGDGVIGEATGQPSVTPRHVVIQIDTVKENGQYQVGDTSALIKLPCSDEQLRTLAVGLLSGLPFSEKQWTPTKDGKPFAANEFRALRAEMQKQKLVEYVNDKDPRQGIRLTDAGRAVMEEYADSPTRPDL
jgi:hypothetical protein